MSTLSNQFLQGSNFIRQNENDAARNQVMQQQNERAQERHQASLASAEQQRQINADKHQEWKTNQPKRETLTDLRLKTANESYKETKHQAERNRVNEGREDTVYDQKQKKSQEQQNLQWLADNSEQELFSLKERGTMSPEFWQRSKGTAFDISKLIEPQYASQLDYLSTALNPQDPNADPSSPEFLTAFNNVFADELNKGLKDSANPETGEAAVNKRIVAVHPVEGRPGEFYAELEVTYANGDKRTEPMTKGRNSDPDVELATIDTGDLVMQVNARKALKDVINKAGLVDVYRKYEAEQIQNAAAKNSKGKTPKYDATVIWNGQKVYRTDMVDEYEKLGEALTQPGYEGGYAPVTLDEYLWTQGDPNKTQAMHQVARMNLEAIQNGENTRYSVIDLWNAEQEKAKHRNQADPNENVLKNIVDKNSPTHGNNINAPGSKKSTLNMTGFEDMSWAEKQVAKDNPSEKLTLEKHAQRIRELPEKQRRKALFDLRYELNENERQQLKDML